MSGMLAGIVLAIGVSLALHCSRESNRKFQTYQVELRACAPKCDPYFVASAVNGECVCDMGKMKVTK